MSKEIREVTIRREVDSDPDLSYLEQEDFGEEGQERLRQFYRGDVWCEGVWANAEVVIGGVIQRIRSGGLWGIESDSGKEYFNEVAQEELNDLKAILMEMGFGEADFADFPTGLER